MNKSDFLTKENAFGIVNHWALAISCIVLTVSGFGFLFQIQEIGSAFGGFPAMKGIHNWAGVVCEWRLRDVEQRLYGAQSR